MTNPFPGPAVARSATQRNLAQGPKGDPGPQGARGPQGQQGTAVAVFRAAGGQTVQVAGASTECFAYPGDSPGGGCTFLVPPSPSDGDRMLIMCDEHTNATTQKVGINPGGAKIEDPQAPGTGSYPTTTVYLVQPSASQAWVWDATKARWKLG